MERKEVKYFKKTDIIVIIAILALALASFIIYNQLSSKEKPVENSVKAEIYYYSDLVKTIDLEEGKSQIFSVPQAENVKFEVDEKGNIRFLSSDCRDQVCVNAGKLHNPGDFAACLPNDLVLKIVSEGQGDDDGPDTVI